jgi:hypothetical protein
MATYATPTTSARSTSGRLGYALLAVAVLAAVVLELVRHGDYWQVAAFGFAPDLALVLGAGAGLAKAQLHPRAVGTYNLLHRLGGPLALAALATLGAIPAGFLIGALAWTFHIALARALGYGLRTPDGFQRA